MTGADTMRAAVWRRPGPDGLRIETIPRPACGPDEVVLRVRRCFFSAMYARAVRVGHARLKGPTVLGRMLAGDIAARGEAVDPALAPGRRVTVNPEQPCGGCFYCQRNMASHCLAPHVLDPGGMAEWVRIPAPLVRGIRPLADTVSYSHAAFCETLACVLQGMESAAISPGDRVAVLGAGGVGLCFAQLALASGAERVWVASRDGRGEAAVRRLGAEPVGAESLPERVHEATAGQGADVVIEAAGSLEAYAQALALPRSGGTLLAFGGLPPGSRLEVDMNRLHYGALRLVGSYRYRPQHFDAALDLIARGGIDLDPVVTHHLPFERAAEEAVAVQQDPDCKALVIDIDGHDGEDP
jgi:L-iditol 2-dehydrogenase